MDEPTREQLVFYNNLYKTENVQLHEEIVYLKELNNGLDYCAEQESLKNKELKQVIELISMDYKEAIKIICERDEEIKQLKEDYKIIEKVASFYLKQTTALKQKLSKIEEYFTSSEFRMGTIPKWLKEIIAGKKL